MRISVEYTAQLRTQAGCEAEVFDIPQGAALKDLLQAIVDKHEAGVADLLLSDAATPASTVLCFVADEQVGWDTLLSNGDVVTLMTPISGG